MQNVLVIDMDIVDHKKEPINKSPKVMSLEETKTSASSIQPTDAQIEIANLRHTKPRRANTNITPQGIYFHSDYQPYHFIGLFYS